jgi:hypothetical protein
MFESSLFLREYTIQGSTMKKLILVLLCVLGEVLGFATQSNPFRRESPLGNYSQAAITIDGKPCAQIGL